jgi:hypothetical protein
LELSAAVVAVVVVVGVVAHLSNSLLLLLLEHQGLEQWEEPEAVLILALGE